MNLYDSIINEIAEQIRSICDTEHAKQKMPVKAWPDAGEHHMILGRETAYELGGSGTYGLSGCLCTTGSLPFAEGIYVCGKDLQQIRRDQSYARIVWIGLETGTEGQDWYHKLREIDYVRYHIHPEGCMTRISPVSQREPIRVSTKALKRGITFADIGQMYLERYQQVEQVCQVSVVFITAQAFSYRWLEERLHKAEQITQSLNQIFAGIEMDCKSCGLKSVCDEVEELRALHFSRDSSL